MKVSELRTIDEVIGRHRADPEFRKLWDAQAWARHVAITVVRYRTDNNLSQAGLAKLAGLRQPTIARLESGEHKPRLHTLQKLAAGTGLTLAQLYQVDRG